MHDMKINNVEKGNGHFTPESPTTSIENSPAFL